jgi:hypothetical protein
VARSAGLPEWKLDEDISNNFNNCRELSSEGSSGFEDLITLYEERLDDENISDLHRSLLERHLSELLCPFGPNQFF